jgi:ketosteroid isomerase-like protein
METGDGGSALREISVSRERVADWMGAYERAWRTAGTDQLTELFTDDATYSQGPYQPRRDGLPEIARMWEETRDGPDDRFTMRWEPVAVDGDTAVVRVEVEYTGPDQAEYRDLWVLRFAPDGRCRAFEEWPFAPGQPITTSDD